MPDGVTIPGGPGFAGTPQPPDVPCDPTGEAWRGPMGPPGPQGIPGQPTAGGPFLPLSGGTVTGVVTAPQINAPGGVDLILPQHLQSGGLTFWPPGGGITFSGATGTPYINIGTSFVGSLSSASAFLAANLITVNQDIVAAPVTNSMSWLGINGNIGSSVTWTANTAYAVNATVTLHGRIYQATTGGTSAASGGPTGTGGAITDGTVVWAYQSPNGTGDRSGFFVRMTVQSEGGDVTAGRAGGAAFVAIGGNMQIAASQGGTNLTTSAAGGAWGANFLVSLGSAVQNFGYMCGAEIDIAAVAGSSVKNKIGLLVVQTVQDAVAATNGDDIGIAVTSQPQGVGPGWKVGLSFGTPFSGFSISSTGTIIGTGTSSGTQLAARGLDFSSVTFSAYSLWVPGFRVAGDNVADSAMNRLTVIPGSTSTTDIIFQQSGNAQFEFNGNILTTGNYAATSNTSMLQLGATNQVRISGSAAGGTGTISVVGEATTRLFIDGSANAGTQINGRFGLGVVPIAKPTVSGAKGSNAALASLMTALAAYGLVIDTTTA